MSTASLEFLRGKARDLTARIAKAKKRREAYGRLQRERIRVVAQIVRIETTEQRRRLQSRPAASIHTFPQLPL